VISAISDSEFERFLSPDSSFSHSVHPCITFPFQREFRWNKYLDDLDVKISNNVNKLKDLRTIISSETSELEVAQNTVRE
jgi:hypothetical protein